ncbi:MAG: hypothetical protein HQK91_06540 [Nitrospirae bacterium]|nr:hypothetical protein [Nitrospirota bacterium]MBF0541091.1 hypothetical protein [Nitrospirota bacterium]
MLSIVFGLIAICFGIWGLSTYWWYVMDILVGIMPIVLIFGGLVALFAGIKNTGIRAKMKGDEFGNGDPQNGGTFESDNFNSGK